MTRIAVVGVPAELMKMPAQGCRLPGRCDRCDSFGCASNCSMKTGQDFANTSFWDSGSGMFPNFSHGRNCLSPRADELLRCACARALSQNRSVLLRNAVVEYGGIATQHRDHTHMIRL